MPTSIPLVVSTSTVTLDETASVTKPASTVFLLNSTLVTFTSLGEYATFPFILNPNPLNKSVVLPLVNSIVVLSVTPTATLSVQITSSS